MSNMFSPRQRKKIRKRYIPAALRRAVRLLEFTIAFTAPVSSSSTSVEPGSPRVSPGEDGTETTLTVVPVSASVAIRAGMNSAVCWDIEMDVRCGVDESHLSPRERVRKTLAIRICSSSGDIDAVAFSTSAADSTSRDIARYIRNI